MHIIGFGHRKHVGKDTAARFLCTQYRLHYKGSNVITKGFAVKLKEICYELYRWAGMRSPEYYEQNPEEKEEYLELIGKTVRQIWIEVGNKLRDVYIGTWLDYLLSGTKADLLIIPDVRYFNEVNAIKLKGGFVIKIDRPYVPHTNDIADRNLADYDKWDAIINNNGDLGYLYTNVITTCQELLGIKLL